MILFLLTRQKYYRKHIMICWWSIKKNSQGQYKKLRSSCDGSNLSFRHLPSPLLPPMLLLVGLLSLPVCFYLYIYIYICVFGENGLLLKSKKKIKSWDYIDHKKLFLILVFLVRNVWFHFYFQSRGIVVRSVEILKETGSLFTVKSSYLW